MYTRVYYYTSTPGTRYSFSAASRKHFRSEFSTIYTCARMIFTIVAFCSDRRRTPPPPLPPAVNRLTLYMYILLYVCMYMNIYIYTLCRYVCCVYYIDDGSTWRIKLHVVNPRNY